MSDGPVTLGWHWLCELEVSPGRATDAGIARRVLLELPAVVGLTPVGPPRVRVDPNGSLVAVVLLAESHASVHASASTVFVDLFSCRAELEPELCVAVVHRLYEPERVSSQVVRRGS